MATFHLYVCTGNRPKYFVVTDSTSYMLSYPDMIVQHLGQGYHGVFPIRTGICNVKVEQANTISWKSKCTSSLRFCVNKYALGYIYW